MTEPDYSRLRVLIADDFSNFRATVNSMLRKLGVLFVDSASSGAGVLAACRHNHFDVILCDYDLGPGRNGQQVLEALRHHNLISRRAVFIVVSADAAKDVVMAAYDCEPDDYLMKPINARMLEQRMARLITQRRTLTPVYEALDNNDQARAIALLTDLSLMEGRHAITAQKLLGEMFIAAGELSKAEKLYTKALQTRQLDWARLGLAKVKQLQGELELAGTWLEQIISDSPLYLPAYDVLASNWEKQGQGRKVQQIIQRSVEISPKSILRHKRLAEVAKRNGDKPLALKALRTTVRLGELSCHAGVDDNLNFARIACSCIEEKIAPIKPLFCEAVDVVTAARGRFTLSPEQVLHADLVEARALALGGLREKACSLIAAVEALAKTESAVPIEIHLDRITALRALGQKADADALLQQLLDLYAGDQKVLQRLDELLAEPASDSSRALIASVNREGIALYNQSQFDEAIAQFMSVSQIFPRHLGVQLNIVQSLVGKLKTGKRDDHTIQQTERVLATIEALIEPGHPQYARFRRLRSMAMANLDD